MRPLLVLLVISMGLLVATIVPVEAQLFGNPSQPQKQLDKAAKKIEIKQKLANVRAFLQQRLLNVKSSVQKGMSNVRITKSGKGRR